MNFCCYAGFNKISLTKNIALPEQNIQTSIVATKTMDDGKKNGTVIWPEFGYFGLQACGLHLDKENAPENSIFLSKPGLSVLQRQQKNLLW